MAYILVIDDDALFCSILRDTLENAGYEAACAGNGLEGLKLYRERRPALIITDIIMPEMDGIETIIELRRLDPTVKIIAVSSGTKGRPSFLGPARLLGAAQTFEKPIDFPELLAAVAELLADGAPPIAS